MSRRSGSATFTSEFGHELETERIAWLRRRFLWYLGFGLCIGVPFFIYEIASSRVREEQGTIGWAANVAMQTVNLLVHGALFAYVWKARKPRYSVNFMAYWLIVSMGVLSLIVMPLIMSGVAESVQKKMSEGGAATASFSAPGIPAGTIELNDDERSSPQEASANAAPEGAGSDAEQSAAELQRKKSARERADQLRKAREFFSDRKTRLAFTVVTSLWAIFISHFTACLFLPWTTREAVRPTIPLLGLNLLLTLGYSGWSLITGGWSAMLALMAMGVIALSLFVPLPGLAVCWWRHARFRRRTTYDLLRGRYTELKHELTSAQQIHEGLFPVAIRSGSVRFEYVYEPMRQIGGDYLHCFVAPDARASFVVMDVTGHGIPAALTVNRLHGELTRIFAEDPDIGPGEVLTLLNRYVHLTLASHSVYVTAMCFRVCPTRDTLEYASGGHPPAFVRDVRGRLEQLDSTTFVLGACAGSDFQHEARTLHFGPGDVLVAYTDGVTEARDQSGRYFGISGIQRLLATGAPLLDHEDGSGGWPGALRQAVEKYRYGPTADDVLVIEIRRAMA